MKPKFQQEINRVYSPGPKGFEIFNETVALPFHEGLELEFFLAMGVGTLGSKGAVEIDRKENETNKSLESGDNKENKCNIQYKCKTSQYSNNILQYSTYHSPLLSKCVQSSVLMRCLRLGSSDLWYGDRLPLEGLLRPELMLAGEAYPGLLGGRLGVAGQEEALVPVYKKAVGDGLAHE